MNRPTLAVVAWLALSALATAGETKLDGHTFKLPDGFKIERVAGPPLVDRPIVADFDDRGRLYVADSSGSNDPVQKQLEQRPHKIVQLNDTDGDGVFDQRTIFADKMMFPEGALWHAGSLYVAAPPSIWKLTDTDGDGVADRREEWFQGKTLTGCANDLHGPYLGPDGWIYWCKGAFAPQEYERAGKAPFKSRAAHIFRRRPEGGEIEPVMTGGMDNPVEVAFTPGGERIFTTTFFQHPEAGRRDGLIHAVYGGLYGKAHDVLDGHPRTGPDLLPVLVHMGPAAPAGLVRIQSWGLGYDYRDSLFAANFNLHKVTRHVLSPEWATFTSKDSDFLVAADMDFHPTDVLEDADGTLLVLDTGGWYKLCCPTSQLGKPDLLGAIYRVRRVRKDGKQLPRPATLAGTMNRNDPERLVRSLGRSNLPALRRRAFELLEELGVDVLPNLAEVLHTKGDDHAPERLDAVWALTRIDHPEARALVREALGDLVPVVCQAAAHSASVWKDREATDDLLTLLKQPSAHNRRVAAEALGRIGDKKAVPGLVEALGRANPTDRVLFHSLTYALIEIGDTDALATALKSAKGTARRGVLIALDQTDGSKLAADDVLGDLTSKDDSTREVGTWIAGRHPDWGGALAASFRDRLRATNDDAGRAVLEGQLASFATMKEVRVLLADLLGDTATDKATRLLALRAMAKAGIKHPPDAWVAALAAAVAGNDAEVRRSAITAARALPLKPDPRENALSPTLLAVARDEKADARERLDALAAITGGPGKLDSKLFAFLRERLDMNEDVSPRLAAADVLARSRLDGDELANLAGALAGLGPLEVDRLLPAFEGAGDDVGKRVVAALKRSPAATSMRVETLKPRLEKIGPETKAAAESLYKQIEVAAAGQKARLESLLAELKGGDIRRGQAVFNGPKAACATCHAIGYLGGKVGPDLTRIGQVRTERDLLESIVFPSASFVRSYEPVLVATKDGKTYNGVLRRDAPDEVVLATGADQEARIPRDSIDELRPGTVSVMPAGLDTQLSKQELADLLAFLKATRW
ncbi:MAG TPA: PVC-type heme-binding CxxCH protein [Isosphaeraceae bacterium]|jgi:putative membrane-bound dehydrogenase-like protein|nr:PVC-type heme-binding CxxCH protein [Isosphaeraceae bacterium]